MSRSAAFIVWLLMTGVMVATRSAEVPPVARANGIAEHQLFPPFLRSLEHSPAAHWSFGGSVVFTDNVVRLTPSKQSREGWLWNDVAVRVPSWTVRFGIRVHAATSLGGDGLAFWLTSRQLPFGGPVMGAPAEGVRGLGLLFDTFDNDGDRNNPAVHVVFADKDTQEGDLDPTKDFPSRVASCVVDFRNTAANDVVDVALSYKAEERTLRVSLTSSRAAQECAALTDLSIPTGYFMGFTSHTGQLADNHDLHYASLAPL